MRRLWQRSGPPFGAPADAGDADAGWTKRGREKHYGYKVHIGMDQSSCIVREAELTAANIDESAVADGSCLGTRALFTGTVLITLVIGAGGCGRWASRTAS